MWHKFWSLFRKKKKKRSVQNNRVNSIDLVFTPVKDLEHGMYVSKLDIPWLDSPFKFQGFTIETNHDLQTLRKICEYVYIDITRQKQWRHTKNKGAKKRSSDLIFSIGTPPERLSTFAQEIARAEENYKEAGKLVTDFMKKVAIGGGIDGTQAKEAVSLHILPHHEHPPCVIVNTHTAPS